MVFLSTGTSSSLLISIGSDGLCDRYDLWRFNLFADDDLPLDANSVNVSLNSSCRRLTLRFELLLSVLSNASVAVFFLLRRFDCADSELSTNISNGLIECCLLLFLLHFLHIPLDTDSVVDNADRVDFLLRLSPPAVLLVV